MNSASTSRNFFIVATLTGLIVAVFAIYPQINLWMSCENKCNGIYAITDFDEPFYAAYLQSLMDGKTRRNSPFSGAADTPENPQNETYLSIQFLATYPLVGLAKVFDLSISELMIVSTFLIGFFSAFIIYWLCYLFTEDDISALVATLIVLFIGNMVGGQGAAFSLFFSDDVHYFNTLIFLRRYVPAMSFPALFLFILFVWKTFNTEIESAKRKYAFFAFAAFTFCVYSYFYIWTTAFAWFGGFILLQGILRFEKLKRDLKYVFILGFSLFAVLIPYFVLVFKRQQNIDSALFINFTHQPDLWRIPELTAYLTTILLLIFSKLRLFSLKDPKMVFLLSLNLVTVIVFNQQIITGKSLQPFHYQFFSVNYLAAFSAFILIYTIFKHYLATEKLRLIITLLVSLPICIGIFDTICGVSAYAPLNLSRDALIPVTNKIREISKQSAISQPAGNVLSFDVGGPAYFDGSEIPALSSQPVLWSVHLNLMPDISPQEDKTRLKKFLYYQNVEKDQLRLLLEEKSNLVGLGFFGGERISDIYTGKVNPISKDEINSIISDYESFSQKFSLQDAQTNLISFVFVNQKNKNDFTNLDRWYQRDEGETFGNYILYIVKLRQP